VTETPIVVAVGCWPRGRADQATDYRYLASVEHPSLNSSTARPYERHRLPESPPCPQVPRAQG